MHLQKLSSFVLLLLLSAVATNALAQEQDSPGTADHPLVSRYTGSFIDGQQVLDFDSYTLPVGPAVESDGQRVASERISLEGKITRTLYRGPKERSTLEIQRNYESALESAGFEILYTCGGKDCGHLFHWIFLP